MIYHRWELELIVWAVAAALLGALYLRQRKTRDATLVDAGWGVGVALAAILTAVLGPGDEGHRVVIGTLGGAENLRVSWLVLRRHSGSEDSRYEELRRRWRDRSREQLTFAVFYQCQAALAPLLGIVFVLAAFAHRPLGTLAWIGVGLWVASSFLEQVADTQLAAFKAVPENKGRTMRYGLWRYSRHPNYFFQFLTWIAYWLIALEAPWGWLGFVSPLLLLTLVIFVTGIGPSEERALARRGDDYRAYQRETSVFVPWFSRNAESRAR